MAPGTRGDVQPMIALSLLLFGALAAPRVQAEEDCGSMVETVTRFRGLVTAVEPLGRSEPVSTTVDLDPRYRVSVTILDVEGVDARLRRGEAWAFGIHSPSRTFLVDPAAGAELDLELHSLACDGTFRRFSGLHQRTAGAIEEFQGRLEAGKAYSTRIRWDPDLGLMPRDRLEGPRHHGLGIDWQNLGAFPQLVPGGGIRSLSFEVVERRTDFMGERRWVTTYRCRILGVRG